MTREKILEAVVRAFLRKHVRLSNDYRRDLGNLAKEAGVEAEELDPIIRSLIRDEVELFLSSSSEDE